MKKIFLLLLMILTACSHRSQEIIEPCSTTNQVVPSYYKEYWLGNGLFIDCPLSAEMMSGQEIEMESRVDRNTGTYNGIYPIGKWVNTYTYLVTGNHENVQFGVNLVKDLFDSSNYFYTVSLRWRMRKTETSCWSEYATIVFDIQGGKVTKRR